MLSLTQSGDLCEMVSDFLSIETVKLIFYFCINRCEEGYQLATQMSALSCQSDGTWSKHSIRCSPLPCPLPTNLSNPHVIITGKEPTPVGGAVTLSCPPGLYLQGSALAECRVRQILIKYKVKKALGHFQKCASTTPVGWNLVAEHLLSFL